jgi:ParB family transcriptional regulator, chromosome partitioning protein
LALNDPPASLRLARETVAEGLSVRELERRVRELTKPETKSISGREQGGNAGGKATTPAARSDPGTRRIEDDLRRFLQTDVHLHVTETGAGRVEVSFYSSDDLERVLDLILKEHRKDY